jgi:6-phosphofructokinase 1
MGSRLSGNAVIGQSGGPTSVINQSLVGVIEEVRKCKHIQHLLGARHGVRGIVHEDFIPLRDVPSELLGRIANTPAAALGSTRDKPDRAYCKEIVLTFKKHNVRYFFYIGGNDSADAAHTVQKLAKRANYDLRVFHIPKTIDNDLLVHDHTPGYGSAAKFVASAVMGDDLDNKSLPGIKVDVIMGRHAGFLTAASILARQRQGDAPHLIYVPECPLTKTKFLADVKAAYRTYGRCVIAVSEGIRLPNGKTWIQSVMKKIQRDSHGNVQLSGTGVLGDYLADLIRTHLGENLRIRADTFGYLQRSFPGIVSKVDAAEARLVGQMAVRFSHEHYPDGASVAMRRKPGPKYQIETFLAPLSKVAGKTKHLHPSYIVNGNDISDAFVQYARPLVGDLPEVGSLEEFNGRGQAG